MLRSKAVRNLQPSSTIRTVYRSCYHQRILVIYRYNVDSNCVETGRAGYLLVHVLHQMMNLSLQKVKENNQN